MHNMEKVTPRSILKHDDSPLRSKARKHQPSPRKVMFSKFSSLALYRDGGYHQWKSYSREEYKRFKQRAVEDSNKVKKAASSCDHKTILRHIAAGEIKVEDICGIEHLVIEDHGASVLNERWYNRLWHLHPESRSCLKKGGIERYLSIATRRAVNRAAYVRWATLENE